MEKNTKKNMHLDLHICFFYINFAANSHLISRNTIMYNLNHIFPVWYLNPPSLEDLKNEVQRLLYQCVSSDTVLHYIRLIKCPYHQEALVEITKESWHQLEREQKEPAVYYDMEGNPYYSWIDIDQAMRLIIRHAHELQIELERQACAESIEESAAPTDEQPQASHKEKIPASAHIGKADVVYCNCTFYGAPYQTSSLPMEKSAEAPADQSDSIAYPSFFRTNAQSITVIQKCFEEAIAMRTKTKCIRHLMKHSRRDGCFDFSNMTNRERATALNQA